MANKNLKTGISSDQAIIAMQLQKLKVKILILEYDSVH